MDNKYTYIIGKARGNGGSSEGSLRYDQPQQLTAEQQKQAQDNIGIDLSANLKREIVETLPATGEANIIYMVKRAETKEDNVYDEYMYIDSKWDKIGSTDVDLSGYYTKEEADDKFLTEHQEIKTINGESIIGTGNVEIKGFSGDYNDLINKPTILNHWFGTQEEYDKIEVKDPNTIYHIEGGGEGGIKTIEVVNEYDEEIQGMTYYRLHKDILLPLLNSGEEYEVKAIYRGEFNDDYVYYRPVIQNKPKEPWTEETFLDVWLYQYPANPEQGVSVLRYVGNPREDGYYYPETDNKSIRPDLPEVVIIEDGAFIYENNDNLYYMIRKLKDYSDCLINREGRVNISFFETNKTDSPQNVQYYPTAVYTDNNKWQWDIQDGEESTSMVYLIGTGTDGNMITVKLKAHHTADNQWVNTKEYINPLNQINTILEKI